MPNTRMYSGSGALSPLRVAHNKPRLEIDDVAELDEVHGHTWATRTLREAAQDLRFAFRTYRKSPALVAVVLVTLMLGIGANVALFSILNTTILAPPQVRDPSRLVGISIWPGGSPRYSEYLVLHDNNTVLQGLAAYTWPFVDRVISPYGLLNGMLVSGNYFAVVGGDMMLGRAFAPEEDRSEGTHPVVVLSYKAWRRFGADPQIVGKEIRLAGTQFVIIGVANRKFSGLTPLVPDFWAPLKMCSTLAPGYQVSGNIFFPILVVGRLPDSLSVEQASGAFLSLASHLFPQKSIRKVTLTPYTGLPNVRANVRAAAIAVFAAFWLVLLIACANVANLLVARGASRRREITLRLSLGASRARVIRQLLSESAVLALAGGAFGLLFSRWVSEWMMSRVTPALSMLTTVEFPDIQLDFNVYLYTFLVSLVAGTVFGLVPALESTHADLSSAMKQDAAPFLHHLRGSRLRDLLVILQVAVCLVLLIGTGLLLRSGIKAVTRDVGFDAANVFDIRIIKSTPQTQNTRLQLAERLHQIPGVSGIALAQIGHALSTPWTQVAVEGGAKTVDVRYLHVTGRYFQTLKLLITGGRQFTDGEIGSQAPVAVVSDATAQLLWPDQSPIGRRIQLGAKGVSGQASLPSELALGPVEVVGTARNVDYGVDESPYCIYLPAREDSTALSGFVVRIESDHSRALELMRAQLALIDKDAFLQVRSFADLINSRLAGTKLLLEAVGPVGLLGLLLAMVGLYAVISNAVTQRTHEIGVRIALGARREEVLRLILRHGLRLTLTGLAVGLPLAAASCRILASVLYKVSTFDLLTFSAVSSFVIAASLFAVLVPAQRATRLDPVVALRHE